MVHDKTGKFILNDKVIWKHQGKCELLVLKSTGVEIILSKETYSRKEMMIKLLMVAQEYENHLMRVL